ncbi:Membrane protein involved in the export of O-antigen and teichoic acid [Oceanobacillus limi]|uniref:Membrane protein involved in the export of O-antigen and teichoic acid n=1 Tax=Oceanobacillus limi TaxID=930131 RepID=A0A1I0A887_9BACI|nr:oligosaccharide flippase family protein [Oceanobacillus limi]SES89452.1 Membrane protein involved in the export of O-antigen and teichoic acid [Oceanobacillus limi]
MIVKKLSLKKNMVWNLAGSIIYSSTQWLLLIVIAKLGNPEMVGQYVLGLAITAPIVLFTDMNLRLALITDMKSSFTFGNYLGTRIVMVGFSFLLFITVVLIIGYDYYTAIVIILIGIAKLHESVSDIFHGQLQKCERMDLPTISDIMKGIGTVISFSVVLYITGSLVLAIIGQIIVWALILLFFDWPVTRKFTSIDVSFHVRIIKRLVTLSIPLGVMALLTSVNVNVPNYLVEYFLGEEELGYFAALLYILYAGDRMVNSIRQPVAPRLAMLFEKKDIRGYSSLLVIFIAIGLFIGSLGVLVAYLLGDFLLAIIYTPAYAAYSGLFVVMMISGVILYSAAFLEIGVIATRHFKIQPYLAALWVMVSVIGGFLLIPTYGVYGAVYGVLLSSLAKFLSLLVVWLVLVKKSKATTKSSMYKRGSEIRFSKVVQYIKREGSPTYYMGVKENEV